MIYKVVIFVFLFICARAVPIPQDNDAIVFVDDDKPKDDKENIITPPVLPIIDHLENDPTTLTKDDIEKKARNIENGQSKFDNINTFEPSSKIKGVFFDGFKQIFSNSVGRNQIPNHSVSFNDGFQGIRELTGSSFSGSQTNSQSSSFSTGFQDLSTSVSTSSSTSGNLFGHSLSNGDLRGSALPFNSQNIPPPFEQGLSFVSALPSSQTISNGRAIAHGSDFDIATAINGFNSAISNAQSLSISNGAPVTNFRFSGNHDSNKPREDVIYINLEPTNSRTPIRFPGKSTNRFSNIHYETVPVYSEAKKKTDIYDIIRIEI